jgi:hypothetical protein
MATSPLPQLVSPVDAARAALDHTRRQLFPIRLERWLVLGLLAFLDQCGRTFRGGGPGGHGGGGVRTDGIPGQEQAIHWLQDAAAWLSAHATLVTLGVLGGVLVIAVLAAVVLWLNAHGVFMYLDAVVSGRPSIGDSWRRHAAAASSYFGWSLGLSLAGLFVLLFAAFLVAAAALAFATGRVQGGGGWLAAAAIAPVLFLLLLALPIIGLAAVALRDFVAPIQLATGLPCGASARLLESLVTAHPGAFVLYLLLKLVVVIGSGIVIAVLGCLTCCIGFLPIVMQVLFQPLFFFERALSVFLLRQMGLDPARAVGAAPAS